MDIFTVSVFIIAIVIVFIVVFIAIDIAINNDKYSKKYEITIGSYLFEKNAKKDVDMLKRNGYNNACIIKSDSTTGLGKASLGDYVYIFIRVGEYDSKEEADNIVNDLIEIYDFKKSKVRIVYKYIKKFKK